MEAYVKYKNHRQEVDWCRVEPVRMWYGESPYHEGLQHFLKVIDLDKDKCRDFAMKDILAWQYERPEGYKP